MAIGQLRGLRCLCETVSWVVGERSKRTGGDERILERLLRKSETIESKRQGQEPVRRTPGHRDGARHPRSCKVYSVRDRPIIKPVVIQEEQKRQIRSVVVELCARAGELRRSGPDGTHGS